MLRIFAYSKFRREILVDRPNVMQLAVAYLVDVPVPGVLQRLLGGVVAQYAICDSASARPLQSVRCETSQLESRYTSSTDIVGCDTLLRLCRTEARPRKTVASQSERFRGAQVTLKHTLAWKRRAGARPAIGRSGMRTVLRRTASRKRLCR